MTRWPAAASIDIALQTPHTRAVSRAVRDVTGGVSGSAPACLATWLLVLCLWLWPAPSQAQQVIDFWSDNTWSTTDAAGQAVGPAMFVCLNAAVPDNCPAGATFWDWPILTYYADYPQIPEAHWIWGPGNTAASPSNLAAYTFTRAFTLNGIPLAGTVYMTADDRVEVRVNGVLAGTAGSIQVANTWPLATIDILPLLVPGQNTIAFTAQNGPTSFGRGLDNYSNNPAGVVFGGRITVDVAGVPGPPTALTATVADRTARFHWGTPMSGGTPTSYALLARYTPGGPVVGSLPAGDTLSVLVNDIPPGLYYVSVQGSNASGPGAESNPVVVSVPGLVQPPGAPVNLVSSITGSTLTLSWSPSNTGGPPTAYLLEAGTTPWFTTAIGTATVSSTVHSLTVPEVPPGVYYVRVAALNGGGRSDDSVELTVLVGTALLPAVPAFRVALVIGHTVTLQWGAGSGLDPTHYLLAATSGGPFAPEGPLSAPVTVADTSLVVTDVPSGTYWVYVRAVAPAGASSPSASLPVVVP